MAEVSLTGAAPGALARGGLRDGLDLETLHLRAVDVARDAREAGVDDGADAGNGDGGFGHVCGEDDAPVGVRGENAVLLGGGQARIQRQHFDGVWQIRAPAGFDVTRPEFFGELILR